MAEETISESLLTVFTPPAACATSYTYEGTYYNTDPGGVLMQALLEYPRDSRCFPSDFQAYGRAYATAQVYSPGWCPQGYFTAQNLYASPTTTAVCCPSSFGYTTYYAGINYQSSSAEFHGCTSTYPAAAGPTTVPARANDTDLQSATVVSGPLLMWAQPITVAYEASDVSLYTTVSSTLTSTSASPSGTTSTAAMTSTGTPSGTAAAASSTGTGSGGLSGGAIAGIAIGAAAVLGILLGLAIFFRRPSRRRKDAVPTVESAPDMQQPWQPGYSDNVNGGAAHYPQEAKPRDVSPYGAPRFNEEPRYEAPADGLVGELPTERRRAELQG